VHGRGDRFIPATDAVLLHAAGPERGRIDIIDGMGHAFTGCDTAVVAAAVQWCLEAS